VPRESHRDKRSTQAERSLKLLKNIAAAANLCRSAESALDAACAEILAFTGWHACGTYLPDSEGHFVLTAMHGLSEHELDGLEDVIEELKSVKHSSGKGMPGRVLSSKKPEWLSDDGLAVGDPKYPNLKAARRLGAKTVIGVPLMSSHRVCGVLAFYSKRKAQLDPVTYELMADIGVQLGRALEREQAEARLRESEARYRGIFDGAIEGIYRTSLEGKNLLSNPALAKMLGYKSAEQVVEQITDSANQVWAYPEERAAFMRLLEQNETVRDYECQYKRRDGSLIWVSLNSKVVRTPDGEAAYYEGFIEDITARKRSEQALRQRTEENERANEALKEKNLALKQILDSVEADRGVIGMQVVANVDKLVMPLVRSLREGLGKIHINTFRQIESALEQITSPFTHRLSRQFASLTPSELKICNLIRNGLGVKQIAQIEHISPETVATHRRNIRRKLGIAKEKANLGSFLRVFMEESQKGAKASG
jgi:PAS domain S-box-containing protein